MKDRLQQIDSNNDGSVSREEMEAMMSRSRQRGPQGRGGDEPGRAGGEVPRRPPVEE